MSDADSESVWRARFERERAARKEAEAILTSKSRELYEANTELSERAEELARSLELLRRTQEALVQREKMAALGGLVAGIAHEINTPLGVAMTAVTHGLERVVALASAATSGQLTRRQLNEGTAELAEAMTLVRDNLERGASLIRSFKRVAVDQCSEEDRVVTLSGFVQDVVNSLRPMSRQARVDVVTEGGVAGDVRLAAGPLTQVLTNLVQNACVHAFDSSGTPRRVHIRLSDSDSEVVLQVSDNGVGMTPEVLAKVFDPFFTTRRSDGGSGLGMHLVYNLVVSHFQGSIEARSAPGEGTSWTVRLPYGTPALGRVASG